jgi:hypothetical protein
MTTDAPTPETDAKEREPCPSNFNGSLADWHRVKYRDHARDLERRLSALQASREADKRDAERRLTYLIGKMFENNLHFSNTGAITQLCIAGGYILGRGHGALSAIDAAIDAAVSAGGPK